MEINNVSSVGVIANYNNVIQKSGKVILNNDIETSKIDSVELNSSKDKNDIMTIYEMLCSEFPEASYILTDEANRDYFFNNVNTRVGSNFGEMSQKSIFIDVSVIKKIQEDPSYYTKAKYEIKLILDQYDSARQEAAELGLPYVTGRISYDYEENRLVCSSNYEDRSCAEFVKEQEKKLAGETLENVIDEHDVEQVMNQLLNDFMDDVTENVIKSDEDTEKKENVEKENELVQEDKKN